MVLCILNWDGRAISWSHKVTFFTSESTRPYVNFERQKKENIIIKRQCTRLKQNRSADLLSLTRIIHMETLPTLLLLKEVKKMPFTIILRYSRKLALFFFLIYRQPIGNTYKTNSAARADMFWPTMPR